MIPGILSKVAVSIVPSWDQFSSLVRFIISSVKVDTKWRSRYLVFLVCPPGDLNHHVENLVFFVRVQGNVMERGDGIAILLKEDTEVVCTRTAMLSQFVRV